MSSESESSDMMSILQTYLKPSALKETPHDTFVAYLGKNSSDADHEAFMEYIDTEFLTNECHKLNEAAAIKIGVYSLLDGMPNVTKGRPPSLSSVLDEQAYQDGNTATYDYYLGERRTREEEQDFRQRLAFVKDIFDTLIDESKAHAVAEYMLGPLRDEEESSEDSSEDERDTRHRRSRRHEEDEPSEEEERSEPSEQEESDEEADRRNESRHHKSSLRKRSRSDRY